MLIYLCANSKNAMILDDHLFIIRKKKWSINHIDWLFSLFGFLFLLLSVCSGFFVPEKTVDVFFLYALINRILKFPTPWKLTMLHFNVTLFSVIFLLIKLFSDTSVVQMNSFYIFNSLLFLSFIFVVAQLLLVIITTIGFLRKVVH